MIYYYTRIIVGASQSGDNYFRFDWQEWYWLFFTVPAPAPYFPTTKEHKNERGRQTMWIVHSTSRISWTKSPYPRFFLVNVSERTRTDFGVFLIPWFVSRRLWSSSGISEDIQNLAKRPRQQPRAYHILGRIPMKPVVLLSLNPSDSDDNDYILNLNLVPESLGRNVEKSIPLQSQKNWGRKSFGIFRLWMPCIYTKLQRIKEIHAGKKDGTVSLLHNSRSGATDIDAKTGLLTSIISQILDAFAASRIRCKTLSSIVWHCSKKHTVGLLYGIGNWNHELFILWKK